MDRRSMQSILVCKHKIIIKFYCTLNSIIKIILLQYFKVPLHFNHYHNLSYLFKSRIAQQNNNKFYGCFFACIWRYQYLIRKIGVMLSKQQLTSRLRQFVENVKSFKKLLSDVKKSTCLRMKLIKMVRSSIRYAIYQAKIIDSNQKLIDEIHRAFKHIYNRKQNNVSTDKIRAQFENLLKQYQSELKTYEKIQRKSISVMRQRVSHLHQTNRKSRGYTEEESERGVGEGTIQMYEVNQQTLHYERMIHIKQGEIKLIKQKMQDAIKVQENMKNLVIDQGQQLDVAEDNINKGNENVHEAHENLIEGRQQHMSANKKKMCIFGIITVILLAILIPILIKFTSD